MKIDQRAINSSGESNIWNDNELNREINYRSDDINLRSMISLAKETTEEDNTPVIGLKRQGEFLQSNIYKRINTAFANNNNMFEMPQ